MTIKIKKVAVIGAGTTGLTAIKSLKEEGFEAVCFEKSSYFGGLWKYHEEDIEGIPSVSWSTSLNNSKEAGAISDFPPDPEYPNYMRHFAVLEMFTQYGNKFDLFRHIHYNSEVIKVSRADNYNTTGRWNVVTKDTKSEEVREEVFDAVMVCVGHLSLPTIPSFSGQEVFKGDIIHTHSLKRFQEYQGKTVCVVGTGSSALDAAVEISHVANQVYLSIRTPCWICTRQGPYGYPLDSKAITWELHVLHQIVPLSVTNKFLAEVFFNPRFSHDLYNIHPARRIMERDLAISDGIWDRLMNGSVIMKKNIKRFTENGIIFENDDDIEFKVDSVVLGTGYEWEFPFLDSRDFVTEGNKIHLYKCVYPPQLPFPTLGVIGFIVPLGPGFPCMEMQCRWFASTLTGRNKLPSKKAMLENIDKQYRENLNRFGDYTRVSVHVDYMPYLEDLASEIGAKPSMLKLLFTDIKLFVTCALGPFLPYRFRLVGPHSWEGARKAILEAGKRMRAPLQGKRAFEEKKQTRARFYFLSCAAVIIVYVLTNKLITFKNMKLLQRLYIFIKYIILDFIKTGNLDALRNIVNFSRFS